MQLCAWALRALAVLTASCILLAGLCALRHEANVAHVRDRLTGQLQHAHALAEHHAHDATPHLHGREVDAHGDTGGCALLGVLDHATILPTAIAIADDLIDEGRTTAALVDVSSPALARYRLAPKTSPPAIG
jgi:hypothetical protein